MQRGYTHIGLVLDASGSMEDLVGDVKGSIRRFAETQKKSARSGEKIAVDAWKFGNTVERVFHNEELDAIPALIEGYDANMGCTALYDAICMGVDELGAYFAELPEEKRPEHVLFVIATDGYENSSVQFTSSDAQDRIRRQKDIYRWEFVFVASGVNAEVAAIDLGFDPDDKDFQRSVLEVKRESFAPAVCECMALYMDKFRDRNREDFEALVDDLKARTAEVNANAKEEAPDPGIDTDAIDQFIKGLKIRDDELKKSAESESRFEIPKEIGPADVKTLLDQIEKLVDDGKIPADVWNRQLEEHKKETPDEPDPDDTTIREEDVQRVLREIEELEDDGKTADDLWKEWLEKQKESDPGPGPRVAPTDDEDEEEEELAEAPQKPKRKCQRVELIFEDEEYKDRSRVICYGSTEEDGDYDEDDEDDEDEEEEEQEEEQEEEEHGLRMEDWGSRVEPDELPDGWDFDDADDSETADSDEEEEEDEDDDWDSDDEEDEEEEEEEDHLEKEKARKLLNRRVELGELEIWLVELKANGPTLPRIPTLDESRAELEKRLADLLERYGSTIPSRRNYMGVGTFLPVDEPGVLERLAKFLRENVLLYEDENYHDVEEAIMTRATKKSWFERALPQYDHLKERLESGKEDDEPKIFLF